MLTTVRHYRRDWLLPDISGGLVLAAFLVPAGMGYAAASGLPVEIGLYASIASLVAYFLVGPSQILVVGPDSALVPLVATCLAAAPPAAGPGRAAVLALCAGLFCIAAGIVRLGLLTDLISKPVRIGYLNGIAITVIAGQVPALTGMPQLAGATGGSFLHDTTVVVKRLAEGEIQPLSVAFGCGCLGAILLLRQFVPRAPGVLIGLAAAAAAVAVLQHRGLPLPALVPAIPPGLPAFALPPVDWAGLVELIPIAGAIALVAAADTSVLSRAYPGPDGQPSPPNRELVALGLANLAAGLFQGMPVSSSSTRTPIVAAAGARSQVACLMAAATVTILIAIAPWLSGFIPRPALAAVVIAACSSLVDSHGFWRLARIRPGEFVVSAVCLLGVVLLGVLPGIVLAVALSLTDFIWRSWRPYDAVLGRVAGVKGYHDIARHPDAALIPGLVIFRWDAPLFFANASMFRRRLLTVLAETPPPVKQVIIAAEPITDIDTTASDILCQLADELHARGIGLAFAELKGPAKDHLKRYGVFARFGDAAFHPTLGRAVSRYLDEHEVAWQDWSD
jgi:high affinity sulfate transporter 1